MQFWFNSGFLYGIDSSDTLPTPVEIGGLTDISVDMSGARKDFNGPYQYPISAARGDGSIVCKAKFGGLTSSIFNNLFLGTTSGAGQIIPVIRESRTIPSSPTYVITPTNIKSGQTFDTNLGVQLVATDGTTTTMTRVSGTPATGQYAVNTTTGIFTFAAADAGKAVLISYIYNLAAGTVGIITITNELMGEVPKFRAILAGSFEGKHALMDLYSCISDKFNLATKKGDYANPELDFAAIANSAGIVGRLSLSE